MRHPADRPPASPITPDHSFREPSLNSIPSDNARNWYLGSIATFMIPAGIQMVLLPYLLAIELNQPAGRFGLTQMVGQLPILIFLLFGGWLADRIDSARLLMVMHGVAIFMPLYLAFALWRGQISEGLLLCYALSWGLVSAFVMPARDGILRRVAGSDVQRMVSMALGVQFATQMLGQALGGFAARVGSITVLLIQCAVLTFGVYVATRLPRAQVTASASDKPAPSAPATLLGEMGGGLSTIFANPAMRGTFLLTIGMGIFFGGVFTVFLPLAIRDLYAGGAQDLSIGFLVFGVGTLLSVALMMRRGGARRPGRAVLLSQVLGCLALAPILLSPPKWAFYTCIFVWGMGGGIAMTMSRTILQEHAPASHQSRVMAAMSLSTAGGTPLGAALLGFAVSAMGVRWAILVPVLGVALITAGVMLTHRLWQLESKSHA